MTNSPLIGQALIAGPKNTESSLLTLKPATPNADNVIVLIIFSAGNINIVQYFDTTVAELIARIRNKYI
jgi:hypothetical protein